MKYRELEDQSWIEAHNAEAGAVWQAFHDGRPSRPPVALGTNLTPGTPSASLEAMYATARAWIPQL